jgi:hypothetical protein
VFYLLKQGLKQNNKKKYTLIDRYLRAIIITFNRMLLEWMLLSSRIHTNTDVAIIKFKVFITKNIPTEKISHFRFFSKKKKLQLKFKIQQKNLKIQFVSRICQKTE